MGMFDHRKHWFFDLAASREQCEQAFMTGLGQKTKPLGKGSRWEFSRVSDQNGEHVVATYGGERGWVGAVNNAFGGMSQIANSVNEGMSGAQLAFKAEPADQAGMTQCEMWLKLRGQFSYGHIAGASSWRKHMGNVRRELEKLDRAARVAIR